MAPRFLASKTDAKGAILNADDCMPSVRSHAPVTGMRPHPTTLLRRIVTGWCVYRFRTAYG
jgi:hypothetical protein